MKIQFIHSYQDIISLDNLFEAWKEFVKGKRNKTDVQYFQLHLADHIFQLHEELACQIYQHSAYTAFNICDPKPRNIHKAIVRDRLIHHAIYRQLYPFFERTFIADSYSCQDDKGTHRALQQFRDFAYAVSKNNTRTCWVLQCDVKKFFANIDHTTLIQILRSYIPDHRIMRLLTNVIHSFASDGDKVKGLPLGNLTSQLFVNVYMDQFDQFVKHKLKAKYYVRYADDFLILDAYRAQLQAILPEILSFLGEQLKLELHPKKVKLITLASGVDFLGWIHFFDHRVLRTTTKRRMMKRIQQSLTSETLQSYLGLLQHGNTEKIHSDFLKKYLIELDDRNSEKQP